MPIDLTLNIIETLSEFVIQGPKYLRVPNISVLDIILFLSSYKGQKKIFLQRKEVEV